MRLQCENVRATYHHGDREILKGIGFEIEENERVALLGLNGTGKTTLLKTIVGLLDHEGDIRVDETPVSSRSLSEIRRKVGFLFNVPEDQLLFPRVIDDVAFALKQRKIPRKEAQQEALEMLEKLEIAELAERPVYELSHGQKLRVALAGILVTKPKLLLLDEPTAGLDPPGKKRLGDLLMTLDASILVATHDLGFAQRVCSRALLLEAGTGIMRETTFEEVSNRWS